MDLREQLQATLGDTYALERELGGGGMSRVFVAEEARLGRRVVVKVLSPELTEGMSAERFAREVRLAARLQHPNIVPLLAAGERDGLAYYTMPFVEGQSLRARLGTAERLSADAAISILRDVARALEYAHTHGVVHRDIKPENILLAGSAAAVTDFGIAKALHAARTTNRLEITSDTLTRAGTSMGTPAYMAPEQAAGDPDVDERADVYAWGVVAYELLSGASPFAGRSAHQLVAAHIGEMPTPLGTRTPTVPSAVAALVMRCLEKDPARRPQSGAELLAALDATRTGAGSTSVAQAAGRRVVIVSALLAVLVMTVVAVVARNRMRSSGASTPPVLAVLPFENVGAASDAYFADGLTEEVRSRLSTVVGLQVIGGRSAAQYKGSTKPSREIGRELGATHLLTGTVRWERSAGAGPGRVRVSPELVRVSDQASVWAQPVEASLTDVFQVQSRVAEQVAGALDAALVSRASGAGASPPTRNAAAYDAYLRGLAYAANLNLNSASSRRAAAEAFERAVALDPLFSAAHAQLARVYLAEANFGATSGMVERGRASAERALALDSMSVEARLAQADVLSAVGDSKGAYRVLQVAERIAPGNAEVALTLGSVLMELERDADALRTYERAARLEPRSPGPPGMLAGSYEAVSRYEEAIQSREREIALAPQETSPYVWQAAAHLLWRADTATARRTLARAEPGPLVEELVRFPTPLGAGRAIWLSVVPPAVTAAQDTMTLAAYRREGHWGTPDLFHLMKARHFWLTGRPALARAHADSVIALLAPVLRRGKGSASFFGWFSQRTTLAEAYAYAGRVSDAAPLIDAYVADVRGRWERTFVLRPAFALVEAAYIDALIGRRDSAVTRLEEALRVAPGGRWISPALLRADPWWTPLHGHPGFERLIADGR